MCSPPSPWARLPASKRQRCAPPSRTSRPSSTGWNIVATIAGVDYYNDSKATNVDATIKALEAFAGGIHLILGGKDKGSDYTRSEPPAARARAARLHHRSGCRARSSRRSRSSVPVTSSGTLGEALRDRLRQRPRGRNRSAGACLRQLRPVHQLRRARTRLQGRKFARLQAHAGGR